MAIKREEVQKIATLARLTIPENEISKWASELSKILDYIAQLAEVDVKNVRPTYQVSDLSNIEREDMVDYNFSREEILAQMLEQEEGHVKVKKIF